MTGPSERRAVLFDEESARAVATRLAADGFTAEVLRERLQGEDDDEDHPWAVVTDAPSIVLEVLVDRYDGWLDEGGAPPPQPLELPAAPRRIKGSQRSPDRGESRDPGSSAGPGRQRRS